MMSESTNSVTVDRAEPPGVIEGAHFVQVRPAQGEVGELTFEVPAKGTDAQAYVTALDDAFGKVLIELLAWTTDAIGAEPPLRRS